MPGAEPFYYRAGRTGCLLIHGISGTPQAMKPMGMHLFDAGITVYGVRLEGHGTSIDDLHQCTYLDWVASAENGLLQLKQDCDRVFCAGLSMGGVIALRMACLYPDDLEGIVTICSPYRLNGLKFKLVPALKRIVRIFPAGPPSINDPAAEQVSYDYHSLPAVHELIKLLEVVHGDLAVIEQPALIISARGDLVVNSKDARHYYDHLGSKKKEIFHLENSNHVATLDYDKSILFEKTVGFIRENSPPESLDGKS